jgi:hypothetical protein
LMMEAYRSGDPYLAFAKQAGAATAEATKATHNAVGEQFNACVLAVQYGMGAEALAQRSGQTPTPRNLPGVLALVRCCRGLCNVEWSPAHCIRLASTGSCVCKRSKLRRKALAYYIHSSQCGGGGRRDGLRFDRAQINSSSMCSTFTPMHASSSSAADAAETAAHENSAIFARLRGREAQPLVSSKLSDM